MHFNAIVVAMTSGQLETARSPPAPAEIVVTGERTSRTVRETPSSVEVFDTRSIDNAAGADRIEQILELIPNVQISSSGDGPTIRGQDTTGPTRDLPAFLGGTRPRTTLVVDGRAVGFNEFVFGRAPLWDLDRIEVFRSPQTTTQGQNSIAGAIFIKTRDPSFDRDYRARVILGDARTREVSFSATGPLSGDVAFRLTGDLRYSRTSSRIANRLTGADPNHDAYGFLRAKLLGKPAALPGSRFELSFTRSASQRPQIEGLRPPFRERRDPLDGYGTFRTNVNSVIGTADLTLLPHLEWKTVLTGGDSRIQRFAPRGLGETRIHTRDWSAESILHWTPDGSLSGTFGASYRKADLSQRIDLSQLSGVGRFEDTQGALGIFGEASWSPDARLHLTAGLRYQRDTQRRFGELATVTLPINLDYRRTFHAWLPKVSLAYDLTRQLRLGALVQRAYNPGGTTLRFDTGAPDIFGSESLWDYEVFARAAFADGRLTANANLFTYAMRNAQRSLPIVIIAPTGSPVTFADLFNVSRANSRGAEFSVNWRPGPSFSMRLGAGLLHTRVTRAEAPYELFEGREFQRSPHLTASAAIDWRPVEQLTLSGQLRHNSHYFSDDLNRADRRVPGWTKLDVRAEYEFKRFRLFGYARNLLDHFYLSYLLSPSLATAGDPRELGLGLEARF